MDIDHYYDYFDTLDFDSLLNDLVDENIEENDDFELRCNEVHIEQTAEINTSSNISDISCDADSASCDRNVEEDPSLDTESKFTKRKRKYRYKKRLFDPNKPNRRAENMKLIPKIMKYDHRRAYSDLFFHVINSMDFPLMFGFIQTYCTPNFCQSQRKYSLEHQLQESKIQGIASFARSWYSRLIIAPDTIFKPINTKIHMTSNTSCVKIVTTFSLSCTFLYDTFVDTPEWHGNETNQALDLITNNNATSTNTTTSTKNDDFQQIKVITSIMNAVEVAHHQLPLTFNPIQRCTTGTVMLRAVVLRSMWTAFFIATGNNNVYLICCVDDLCCWI